MPSELVILTIILKHSPPLKSLLFLLEDAQAAGGHPPGYHHTLGYGIPVHAPNHYVPNTGPEDDNQSTIIKNPTSFDYIHGEAWKSTSRTTARPLRA